MSLPIVALKAVQEARKRHHRGQITQDREFEESFSPEDQHQGLVDAGGRKYCEEHLGAGNVTE